MTRRLIESRLTALGFEAGPVDGEFDGRTRRAIRQFQRSRNLDPTGYVNQAAVVQLLVRLKM
ncbi:MAG: peptidoglycan-binding domain-containing protein [Yoonia sp.]|nr:peptidoglycan-binding domain-containing protein [Yoonia sp.]